MLVWLCACGCGVTVSRGVTVRAIRLDLDVLGMRKAQVLPEPVWAQHIRSRCEHPIGIACRRGLATTSDCKHQPASTSTSAALSTSHGACGVASS